MRKALKSDPHFEKQLPQIAAFKAHEHTESERSAFKQAVSEDLADVITIRDGKINRFGHVATRGRINRKARGRCAGRESNSRAVRKSNSSGVSREFQRQLRDMGWPRRASSFPAWQYPLSRPTTHTYQITRAPKLPSITSLLPSSRLVV